MKYRIVTYDGKNVNRSKLLDYNVNLVLIKDITGSENNESVWIEVLK